jgi:glutamate racemase
LQKEYLPKHFPDRHVIGIVSPTVQAVAAGDFKRVGLIATEGTIKSAVYETELSGLAPEIEVTPLATPLLVPLIENGGDKYAPAVIADYMQSFTNAQSLADVHALVLGCTHYPHYKEIFAQCLPGVTIISQDEIIPEILSAFFTERKETEEKLGRGGGRFFGITDAAGSYAAQGQRIFGGKLDITHVAI